ncbi:MAG TPA: TonB-dependent receptor [Bacteroides mediterraneensis]|uniref:SusC/RagA family TonB-linked outer membrane protein n=1 Tax=Bacteroides mediterraneensis TaxID=1841856 RepID=UPI00261EC4D0|nr:TonB-dependent receptor [Bacteroides mediterraneensis]HJH66127.1 TonB-dependent receptor [Bacteroides mediterraneensis]
MKKQLIFSAMLGLCALGSTAVYPISAMAAVAQSPAIKVRGQVVDEQGEPLLGATIRVKNTSTGTTTDLDGNFQLEVPGNAVLLVSYVGYKEREVAVRNRSTLEPIQLQSDDFMLEQVVVVGYGTQKKSDLTGSVAVVDTEALKQVSHSNISSMLEGKVAGVQVTSDGQPGADPTVRIRGIGSFGDTSPLYVIDGVPMGTSIRDFSSNDIETIQVLKDASAAAIYGSRAANGVVIITTKRGKKDQPLKVDYNGYFGVDNISKGIYDVMNADQYSQFIGQACLNSNTPLPGGYSLDSTTGRYKFMDDTDTDWFDEVFKTGIRQNHNVNLSGGSARSTYNVSLDYFNQKGTLEGAGPNYERFTARVNNTMDTKFVKFQTSVVYSHSDQDNMSLSNASEYVQGLYGDVTNVLRGTLLMQPTIKAYDSSTWVLDDKVGAASDYNYDAYGYGVYYDDIHGDISASNPLLINNLLQRNTRVDRFVGTGSADVDILKMFGIDSKNHKLNYKINLSYSKTHCKDFTWIPSWIQSNRVYLAKSNERLEKASRDYSDALIENILTYDGTIGKHHINIVAGQTYEEENTDLLTGWGLNYTEPYFLQLQNGSDTYSSSYEYKHAILSYIGRVNYNYDDRYLFSATVRRDASSRLSSGIRWGTFPSVSVGWRFDKESFFPFNPEVVNMFKVRGSYGELGNENIGEYMYQATMSRNNMTYSFNNSPVTGSAISTFVDNNLSWEKKKTYNAGIDLALFNNRLEFTAEWYKNTSTDLLYSVPVPEQAGVSNTTVTMNAASMENSGFEFSATYRNHDHPFKYEVSANLSTLKNRVTSLGFGTDYYLTGDYITYVGQEIGQFYGYVYEGIARTQEDLDNHAVQEGANVGDCLYKDINDDGRIDTDDRVVLGSGLPKINFGLNARFEYKGFDLSIATYGALNYHVSDDIYNSLNSCYGWSNKEVAMLDANRFSEDGTTYLSDVPRTYITNSASLAWNDLFSSRKIQNAAYWKIANVELGYNFPDKWFGKYISDVRLYVSAQNLYTFTGYKGYNVDYAGGTFTPGYNFCSYPTARTFMCGVHFTF